MTSSSRAGEDDAGPVESPQKSALVGIAQRLAHLLRAGVAPLVGAIVIAGLWYLAIVIFDIEPFLLPRPDEILVAFVTELSFLYPHLLTTLMESVGGLFLAILIGVTLGILIAEIPSFHRAILPWLVMSQAIPKVAMAPLFVIWFGFGMTPKVVVAAFIAFFPIVISTVSGLGSISSEELDLFRTQTRRRWPLYRHLKIPRALPQFFDGVKVATTLALIGAVVGEFVSSQRGLGYLVIISNRDLRTVLMFAEFLALALLGIILFYAVVLVERLLMPWRFAQKSGARTASA